MLVFKNENQLIPCSARLSVQPAPAVAGAGCFVTKSTIATVLSASSGSLIGPAGEYNFPVQAPYERVIHESKCDGGLRPAIQNANRER